MENEPNDSAKAGGKSAARRGDQLDPAITKAFKQVPDSRAHMVERARRLARDPGYPSDETLRLISEILATHLEFDGYSY